MTVQSLDLDLKLVVVLDLKLKFAFQGFDVELCHARFGLCFVELLGKCFRRTIVSEFTNTQSKKKSAENDSHVPIKCRAFLGWVVASPLKLNQDK